MSVMEDIGDFFSGAADTFTKIEKDLEHHLIKSVFAPLKKAEVTSVKNVGDLEIKMEGVTVKNSVFGIGGQLDSAMKGEFSSQVIRTIKDEGSQYEQF